ncbi:hypothetical protein SteCoe_26961 [Stentor coeruleus]|uniref:LITAF domain-containing protein n=1 Tax=Stentor coeruleus TaxID=5963 RepID=A0A1R2BBQ1_9CILI|nr:hypothetical protein SteCoe_26961 [Stentor coeruleus]
MDFTPEKPSLECFSSIRSSSFANISDLPFWTESSEIQTSREDRFSTSMLMNLREESNKPYSKLINITVMRPGHNPKKLLLPLFFQEKTENQIHFISNQPKSRRSCSVGSVNSYSYIQKQLQTDEKKIITTTTNNTQSNFDIIEIIPDLFKDKVDYNYEKELKISGININLPEYTINPTLSFCKVCGETSMSIVEKEVSRVGNFLDKIQNAFCCCIYGMPIGSGELTHRCSNCKAILFRFNE